MFGFGIFARVPDLDEHEEMTIYDHPFCMAPE